jgi:large subunit ribosomal protein L6
MSRIGKMPVTIPAGVTFKVKGSVVEVQGAKGTLKQAFHPDMSISQEDGSLIVNRPSDSKEHRALHGLTRALLNNMVEGVSTGFTKRLEILGVGYRAEMKGSDLIMHLGYSHPIEVPPPTKETNFTVENRGRLLIVDGIDKQVVGEISAKIRKLRPPEPYKGKGVRYQGEYVRQKAGKTGKV